MSLAGTIMGRKRKEASRPDLEPAPKRMGRPKGSGRITQRYSIVTTPEYRAWMEGFLKHIGETEVSDAFREAIRRYAEAAGFRTPPKR